MASNTRDMSYELDEVVANIRATLLSSKDKIDMTRLSTDYKAMIGEQIPFRKFGYTSLRDFLGTIPSLQLTHIGGTTFITPVYNSKVQHIVDMIKKQKASRSKNKRMPNSKKSMYPVNRNINNASGFQMRAKNSNYTRNERTVHVTNPPRVPTLSEYSTPSVPKNRTQSHVSNSKIIEDRASQSANVKPQLPKRTVVKTPAPQWTEKNKKVYPRKENVKRSSVQDRLIKRPPENIPNSVCSGVIDSNGNAAQIENNQENNNPQYCTGTVQELNNFCTRYGMSTPVYDVLPIECNGEVYVAVEVAGQMYSNYPEECESVSEARIVAARHALNDLKRNYLDKTGFPTAKVKDILQRIPPMVINHDFGVWSFTVRHNYEKEYREELPANWLQILEILPDIAVDQALHDFVIYYKPKTNQDEN